METLAPSQMEFARRSLEDRDGFWREQAAAIDWERPFDDVCDSSNPPFVRWFPSGRTNLCHNAVDRHRASRGDQVAIRFLSTETGEERGLTYRELHREVNRMAAVLQRFGLKKGERVVFYLPVIPEAAVAMLACARLGIECFFILGRIDDVINVAGHRIGTREIEEALSTHSAVAESAAVGAADEIKHQVVKCFVVLKNPDHFPTEESRATILKEIEQTVVTELGSLARPAVIGLVSQLPKTRSGKVLRRAIVAIAENRDPGDLSTLEDPLALDHIREAHMLGYDK